MHCKSTEKRTHPTEGMAVARLPAPWFRRSTKTWYVRLNGRQIRLGKSKAEAHQRFAELVATPRVDTPITFAQLVERYLASLAPRVSPRTHYVAACYLRPVLATF